MANSYSSVTQDRRFTKFLRGRKIDSRDLAYCRRLTAKDKSCLCSLSPVNGIDEGGQIKLKQINELLMRLKCASKDRPRSAELSVSLVCVR